MPLSNLTTKYILKLKKNWKKHKPRQRYRIIYGSKLKLKKNWKPRSSSISNIIVKVLKLKKNWKYSTSSTGSTSTPAFLKLKKNWKTSSSVTVAFDVVRLVV